MDELIAQLTQRVGLTPDQARQAAETALGFVKARLPAPLASQVDRLLGASGGGAGGLGDLTRGIGGMFGG